MFEVLWTDDIMVEFHYHHLRCPPTFEDIDDARTAARWIAPSWE